MDSPLAWKNKKHICVYEFVGTAFLTLMINITKDMGSHALPAITLVVMCFVMIIGPVSGGHVNPAITIGQFIGYIGKQGALRKLVMTCLIILSQILGAIVGCLVAWGLLVDKDKL